MRIPRALTLTVITAVAALALTATASAQDLEATNAATGIHCGSVTPTNVSGEPVAATGGCEIGVHSNGSVEFSGHLFGIEQHSAHCDQEFTARLDEEFEGYFINQALAGSECTREPCEHANGQREAWPVHGRENPGQETLRVLLCVDTAAMDSEINCEFDIPFTQIDGPPNPRRYEFTANDLNGHGMGTFVPRCELTGHWTTATDMDDVAITHL